MLDLVVAAVAGALIGLSLGALGGGGSILAVPVLVYALGQSPGQAPTGSLVVVGVTALIGAVTAYRAGNVLLARGVSFGLVAIGGAALGGKASALVSETVLLAAFAMLMLVVGGLLAVRQVRAHGASDDHHVAAEDGTCRVRRHQLDDPIIGFNPTFACQCPRALKVLVTAIVGLLTGFLGVGGGFLVVPALLLALALPMEYAAGTSLVVITLTSAAALAVRTGVGSTPDWGLVLVLTVVSALGGFLGAKVAERIDTSRLSTAFTVLVLAIAFYTAARALPALV
ncbi:MAG: sulfite exporter TauE/SafE family protein [Nocardioides sp.]